MPGFGKSQYSPEDQAQSPYLPAASGGMASPSIIGGSSSGQRGGNGSALSALTTQFVQPQGQSSPGSTLDWVNQQYARYGQSNPGLLTENPPEYWAQRIEENGGLGNSQYGENYWSNRMSKPTAQYSAEMEAMRAAQGGRPGMMALPGLQAQSAQGAGASPYDAFLQQQAQPADDSSNLMALIAKLTGKQS